MGRMGGDMWEKNTACETCKNDLGMGYLSINRCVKKKGPTRNPFRPYVATHISYMSDQIVYRISSRIP